MPRLSGEIDDSPEGARERMNKAMRSFMPGGAQASTGAPMPGAQPQPVPSQEGYLTPDEKAKLQSLTQGVLQGNSPSHFNPSSPVNPNQSQAEMLKAALSRAVGLGSMGVRAAAPMAMARGISNTPNTTAPDNVVTPQNSQGVPTWRPTEEQMVKQSMDPRRGPPGILSPDYTAKSLSKMYREWLRPASNPTQNIPGQGLEVPGNTNIRGASPIQGPMTPNMGMEGLRDAGILRPAHHPLDVYNEPYVNHMSSQHTPANTNQSLDAKDYLMAILKDRSAPSGTSPAVVGGTPSPSSSGPLAGGSGPSGFMNSQGMQTLYPEISPAAQGGGAVMPKHPLAKAPDNMLNSLLNALLKKPDNQNTQFGPGNPDE